MAEVVHCDNKTEIESTESYAKDLNCSSVAYSGPLNVTQMYVITNFNAENYFRNGELQLASFTDTTMIQANYSAEAIFQVKENRVNHFNCNFFRKNM